MQYTEIGMCVVSYIYGRPRGPRVVGAFLLPPPPIPTVPPPLVPWLPPNYAPSGKTAERENKVGTARLPRHS